MVHCAGGVIEENEVFGNKFDGICLATGVNPKLKGEHQMKSMITHDPSVLLL